VVCDARALNLPARTLYPCARVACRPVQQVWKRLVHDAHDSFILKREPDLDGEISVARDKAVRPVQRVNHPHSALAEATGRVNRLFGENTVVRELVTYSGDDEGVGSAVCFRHRLFIVGADFLFDVQRPVIILERQSSGLARQPPRNLDLALITFLYPFNC
jgi:hypothetical protein